MADIYQATYDAVRSKIGGVDLSETARRAFDISFQAGQVQAVFVEAANEMMRPSAIYKPTLTQDGNAWLAVLGDPPTGVVGVGRTPAAAMHDFDTAWHKEAKSYRNAGIPAYADDLLSAAKALIARWPKDQQPDGPLYDEAQALIAAIAKAEGRE